MESNGKQKVVLLGASRGLGKAVALQLTEMDPSIEILEISRKAPCQFDFAQEENWPKIVERINDFRPQRLFYFAGGGPYKEFSQTKWEDNIWAFRVNLLFPAFLLLQILNNQVLRREIQQLIFVGSAVAESLPDAKAASYCSAKHGLKGLISTLQKEGEFADLRLFSPGYMLTDLLPKGVSQRANAKEVSRVARDFLHFSMDHTQRNTCILN